MFPLVIPTNQYSEVFTLLISNLDIFPSQMAGFIKIQGQSLYLRFLHVTMLFSTLQFSSYI